VKDMIKKEQIHFASVDELLGAPQIEEGLEKIAVELIHPFKNHPFKVIDDDKMEDLVESIKDNGVLNPVILRLAEHGTFEMISGHRRLHAAKKAGLEKIPAIVKNYDDDEAILVMVDSNVQREEVLPSERAWSLKMKMDVMEKRQGKRNDLTSCTQCTKSSAEIAGENYGLKKRQVLNYIRLTELIPDLLNLVDLKKISIVLGVDISYFDKELQQWILEYFNEHGALKPIQIQAVKDASGELTQDRVIELMDAAITKKASRKVSISEKTLDRYFPEDYDAKKREQIIISLLEQWSANL
jgi:ParB family chromosome partitioning protein